ncbi:portal protein [bacterium]|nr:portal protein [bacterium]
MARRHEIYDRVRMLSEVLLGLVALHSVIALLASIGFYIDANSINLLMITTRASLICFVIQELLRFLFYPKRSVFFSERWLEFTFSIIFIAIIIEPSLFFNTISYFVPGISSIDANLIFLATINIILIIIFTIKASKYTDVFLKVNLHPAAIFAISFAIIILIGSFMLILPKATVDGDSTSYIDALFTSTSAVCVTGLVVENTATHFSRFGQIIILILIQIGGLGVMTLTTFFAAMFAGGLSVRIRLLMREYLGQLQIGGVAKLIKQIFAFTFVIEGIGAIFLFSILSETTNLPRSEIIYQSIFHSISAFCNAGFSTFQNGLMDFNVQNNAYFIIVIMLLIILGGLGFTVLLNISELLKFQQGKSLKFRIKTQLRSSTKFVLLITFILVVGGAIVTFFLNPDSLYKPLSFGEKVLHSFFLSVTSRTAGYNTLPSELLPIPVALFVIFLMWIGASPGSTGGGIKTTTISLAMLSLYNHLIGKERVEIFHREVDQRNINQAFLVIGANLAALAIALFLIVIFEPDKNLLDLAFELVSAASTVGLSRNLSPSLSIGGKIIIIIMMFVGRVGFLNFFSAFIRPSPEPKYHYPKEGILVG